MPVAIVQPPERDHILQFQREEGQRLREYNRMPTRLKVHSQHSPISTTYCNCILNEGGTTKR